MEDEIHARLEAIERTQQGIIQSQKIVIDKLIKTQGRTEQLQKEIDSRIDSYGRKKSEELDRLKASAINKIQDLLKIGVTITEGRLENGDV